MLGYGASYIRDLTVMRLRIGSNHYERFDTAALPLNLEKIGLSNATLVDFPDFSSHSPSITVISLRHNEIQVIPRNSLNNLKLKILNLEGNRLPTVPDL